MISVLTILGFATIAKAEAQQGDIVVRAGDWFEYSVVGVGIGSQNFTERLTVTNVSNPMIYFNVNKTFTNGTKVQFPASMNESSLENTNLQIFYFMPANVTAGSTFTVPVSEIPVPVSEPLKVTVQSKVVDGLTVDYVDFTFTYLSTAVSVNYEWQQATGVPINETLSVPSMNIYESYILKAEGWVNPIQISGVTYYVSTTSNSTVSSFSFSQSAREISFNVTGASGTKGYCNVTIPTALLSGPYSTYIDGSLVTPTVTSNSTSTSLYFTYTHSTHQVEIIGAAVVLEFPSDMMLAMLMIASAATMIYLKKKVH
jgi:hypothetical protein